MTNIADQIMRILKSVLGIFCICDSVFFYNFHHFISSSEKNFAFFNKRMGEIVNIMLMPLSVKGSVKMLRKGSSI